MFDFALGFLSAGIVYGLLVLAGRWLRRLGAEMAERDIREWEARRVRATSCNCLRGPIYPDCAIHGPGHEEDHK
jgi:hypothetical protein